MKIGISKKVTGMFMAGISVYVFSIGMAYIVISDLIMVTKEMDVTARKVNLTGDLKFYINKLLEPANNYLITGNVEERDRFDTLIGNISQIFKELEAYRGGADWDRIAEDVKRDAIKFGTMAVEILFVENPVGNKRAAELIKELSAFADVLVKEADEFHNITEADMERKTKDAERKRRIVQTFSVIVMAIAFLSLVPLYLYLKRFITAPILQLHNGARIIGSGSLDYRLHIKTGDEIEELANGFNLMAGSLESARKELDRRILELYTLYNVSKVLSTSFETEELLKEIVDSIGKGLKIDRVVIMLIDDPSGELYIASHTNFIGKDLKKIRFKIGQGFYGWAAITGEARMIKEVENETAVTPEERLDPAINSIITVPFGVRARILGLLNVYKNKPQVFNGKDMELMKAVAEHVGLALENARLYRETKLMAITDGLTGLYNHRFFIERLKLEIDRTKRYGRHLSLLMIDIDYFKHYNDTHGHQMGDAVLKLMAELFKRNLRNIDIAARYGGEEFAIILPETDKDSAVQMAERIRKTVEDYHFPYEDTQPEGNLTISLGIALLDADTDDTEKLIKKADDALYKAKEMGRNRAVEA